MKRKILYPIYMLVLLFTLGACQDEDWRGSQSTNADCLTLSVSTMASSRADVGDVSGEDRFNENTVTRADVYFFPSDAGQNENQTCLYADLGVTVNGNTLQVELDKNVITDGNTYYIYVVANYDLLNGAQATSKTLADLKATVLTTQWKDGYSGNNGPETSLAMDGTTEVTISPEGTSGHVDLTRAMAKVMLFPTAEDEITVGEGEEQVTYRPALDRMKVTMVYGVNKTQLDGRYAVNANNDYITRMLRSYQQKSDRSGYEQIAPFYSYPNPEATTDRKDTYLILCVPWYVSTGSSDQAVNYYYRVPITGDDSPALMERNKYYEVHTTIGVLGSLSPHDAVEVNSNFVIHNWFNMEIDAAMQNYKYLVLDEYTSVMNNVDRLEMPYISSNTIDWERTEIVSVTYPNYSQVNFSTETLDTSEEISNAGFSLSLNESNGNLVISHTLTADDYVPYTITVKVWNTDGVEADLWKITQYPAIYIEGKRAEGNLYVAGRTSDDTSPWNEQDQWYDNVSYEGYDLGSVQNPESVDGSGTNRNPNNYTIYVTSFDVGDNYAIGDPRTLEADNLSMSNLNNYRPSRTDDDTKRVIAPAFKIASSRGKTLPISFDNAQRRCAAYQEDGYGAGRWRIPTEAEIEFVVNLSAEHKIPTLFDGEYWSASGLYYSSEDQDFHDPNDWEESDEVAVRCVYDIWYWGTEQANLNQFDWRD